MKLQRNRLLGWLSLIGSGMVVWLFFPFLKSFFVALLLAIALSPMHRSLQHRFERYSYFRQIAGIVSAGAVSLLLSLIIFFPIVMFLYQLLDHPQQSIETIRSFSSKIDMIGYYLPNFLFWMHDPLNQLILQAKTHADEVIAFLVEWLGSGLKTFLGMLAEMGMIVVFFFFLSWYGSRIILFLFPVIPLSRSIKREFLYDMMTTTAVVFYTFLGVMLAQGLAFGLFIAFFEGYNPFLLGFLTGISAIIPVVGTALVWIPVAVNEFVNGHVMNAIVISIYSWAMMAFFIDNFVKLLILNQVNRLLSAGKQRLNEFVIFFALVGGLATFGFWGLILGPAIVAFTVTSLRLLRKCNRNLVRP